MISDEALAACLGRLQRLRKKGQPRSNAGKMPKRSGKPERPTNGIDSWPNANPSSISPEKKRATTGAARARMN